MTPSFAADTVAAAWADPAAPGGAPARRDRAAVRASASSSRSCPSTRGPRRPTPPPTSAPPPRSPPPRRSRRLAALLVVGQALAGAAVDTGSVGVVLGTLAAASMLLGNVMALRQTESTRLLAWSTVSQAGWVVLPVAALSAAGPARLRRLRARVCRGHPRRLRGGRRRGGRGRWSAPAACCAATGWPVGRWPSRCSCSPGLPPGIIGLVAKVVALRPAVDAGLWPLALVAVVAVVLGIAVYLRWFALLLGAPRPVTPRGRPASALAGGPGRTVGATAVLVLGTGILVLFSVLPGLLLGLLS